MCTNVCKLGLLISFLSRFTTLFGGLLGFAIFNKAVAKSTRETINCKCLQF